MNILIMHGSIVGHDAIGNDILGMYQTLARDHTCFLFSGFANNIDGMLTSIATAQHLLEDPDTLAIYHHSFLWKLGEELLIRGRSKIVFKYHNVTPARFFDRDTPIYISCNAARDQTTRLLTRFPDSLWMADSLYNTADLPQAARVRVVPPFLPFDPNSACYQSPGASADTRLLMVGRLAPNKGHRFALDVVDHYKSKYEAGISLIIVGKRDDPRYFKILSDEIAARRLEKNCRLVGEVDLRELVALYAASTAYLCCSEHEGFCVPLIEAQLLQVPVIARSRAAILETSGPAQVVLGEDPCEYATELYKLVNDAGYRKVVIAAGLDNYLRRFAPPVVEQQFLLALREFAPDV